MFLNSGRILSNLKLRMEIRKTKNEKRLDKIEEARKKEPKTRLMKEKLCDEISNKMDFD